MTIWGFRARSLIVSECRFPLVLMPGAVSSAVVDEAAVGCVRVGPAAEGFVSALASDHPGSYSTTELVSLADRYGSLTTQEVAALAGSGFDPGGDSGKADVVIGELFSSCDVEPPGQ
ncbi:MAG: hypothetical protein GY788_31590 [bacterium]|nr:hypothetical protein [bacterium]